MILYAQTHRDEVSGLVLVDSSHPEQIKRLPGMMSAKALKQSMQLLLPLAHWGLMRWFNFALLRSSYPGLEVLAPEAQSAFTALASSPENYITAIREAEDLETSVTQMRVAPGVLGDLPLAVLTAGFWNSGGFMADTKQKWLAMQREHAAMSSRGTHTIVPNCNHASIVTHGRAAVVAAIQQVIKVHG
jgi:pimeloyl-ACP methyl ester carboxylesterase